MKNEVYFNNLKAYENNYGKYEDIEVNEYVDRLENCKNNCKTIKLNIGNKKIYINSKYDPLKEARKYYENFEKVNYGSVLFVFGFGLSYYIRELYNKVKNRATIIVYENDIQLFDIVMKNIDISDILINNDIRIVFKLDELLQLIKNCDYSFHSIPHYKEIYLKEYLDFLKKVKNVIREIRINSNTLEYFKNYWARSNFSNLEYILKSYAISSFKNIFKGKPIIVVGAGPSLIKNVKLLKKLQGKVCIISVFSATRALRNEGIKPDFITTIDSVQYGITEFEKNIPLLFIPVSSKEILSAHTGKKIVSLKNNKFFNYLLEEMIEVDNVSVGATVSLFSVDCARYFGASQIILIGQDFSWSKGNIHVKGSVHKITPEYENYHHYNMPVKDIYGNTVYSNEPFMIFKENFENYVETLPKGVKLIQATEGGLSIKGADTKTLQECIDLYCNSNFCNIEKIISNCFEQNNIVCEESEIVYKKIKKLYEQLSSLNKLLVESVILSKKLFKNVKYSKFNINQNNKIIKRLDKIDNKVKKNEIIKELMTFYANDIFKYFVIEEDKDENVNFAIMNQKIHVSLKNITVSLLKIIKESMGYED